MGKRGIRRKGRAGSSRRTRRQESRAGAAAAISPSTAGATKVTTTAPRPPAGEVASEPVPESRRRSSALLPLAGLLVLGAAAILFGTFRTYPDDEMAVATPEPSVIAGLPGGAVIPDETATPTPDPTPEPTAPPTAQPTPEPTPTPAPVDAATPQPAPATPEPTQDPEPTAVVVAMARPEDSVLAFYQHVEAGNFDDAYALWSDRMRATYPRGENLDQRFDDTADVTFQQLTVVEQTESTAVVQANFTEVYEAGSSREFIGYWELIRTGDGWQLYAPHY